MALTVDRNSNEIQALPIHAGTKVVAVPSNEPCASKVVHVHEDCTVLTFHFGTTDIEIGAQASGMDFALPDTCTGVTADAALIIS